MVALIDGDILAYRYAYAFQTDTDWGDVQSRGVDLAGAKQELDAFVSWVQAKTATEDALIALSDLWNFRLKVTKTYKANRQKTERPELIDKLKQHMMRTHETAIHQWLEADDVIGIYMTTHPGEFICCTIDKDLKQIPGEHFNWNHDKRFRVTLEEADAFFYRQIISGDPTDGYGGCPGYGEGKAEEIVREPTRLVPYQYVFKKGSRKGESETRYEKVKTESIWEAIVSRYEEKGLTEADALITARLARILRCGEYDFDREEVKLWSPTQPCCC